MLRLAFVATLLALPATAQQIDCRVASTTRDLTFCADRDFRQADALLNQVYREAIARTQGLDRDGSARGLEEALRQAQRAWLPYRDATCAFEAMLFQGGSIAPMIELACLARLTEARTADIEAAMASS